MDQMDIKCPILAYEDLLSAIRMLAKSGPYLSRYKADPGKTFTVQIYTDEEDHDRHMTGRRSCGRAGPRQSRQNENIGFLNDTTAKKVRGSITTATTKPMGNGEAERDRTRGRKSTQTTRQEDLGRLSMPGTEEDSDEMDRHFEDIIVPRHEVIGAGSLRRSHFISPSKTLVRNYSGKVKVFDTEPSGGNHRQTHKIEPADLGALAALRENISTHLLDRLPLLSALKFFDHPKDWAYKVFAFRKPKRSPHMGPALYMEVQRRAPAGRYEREKVTWNGDIVPNHIELETFAKEARNRAELYALIKYYFLLATEAKLFGHDYDSIPINGTFVDHLTSICSHLGEEISNDERSPVRYTDESKSSSASSKALHRPRAPSMKHDGLARFKELHAADDGCMSDFVIAEHDDNSVQELGAISFQMAKLKNTSGSKFANGVVWNMKCKENDGQPAAGTQRHRAPGLIDRNIPRRELHSRDFGVVDGHEIGSLIRLNGVSFRAKRSGQAQRSDGSRRDRRALKSTSISSTLIANRRPPDRRNDSLSFGGIEAGA
ncbi:hypothetical protein EK21DRAFT_117770 [Setomelanomma holmii]|uniref:Uncharacterized protein n=1 Tax=Setomelanomma holmii TaxID=210430 RepID=A0A9P4LHD3_9PLEO|nr:hypothetical protein EK21DRAFT_117770 [Setomelanomma holmii]